MYRICSFFIIMKNKILTVLQAFLVILWAIASYTLDKGDSLNLAVFNILPIPNFGLMFTTFTLIIIGYWLEGFKNKTKHTTNF